MKISFRILVVQLFLLWAWVAFMSGISLSNYPPAYNGGWWGVYAAYAVFSWIFFVGIPYAVISAVLFAAIRLFPEDMRQSGKILSRTFLVKIALISPIIWLGSRRFVDVLQ